MLPSAAVPFPVHALSLPERRCSGGVLMQSARLSTPGLFLGGLGDSAQELAVLREATALLPSGAALGWGCSVCALPELSSCCTAALPVPGPRCRAGPDLWPCVLHAVRALWTCWATAGLCLTRCHDHSSPWPCLANWRSGLALRPASCSWTGTVTWLLQ